MAQAQGSRHSVAFIAESTFGTTPATPEFTDLPNTGCTLRTVKDNFMSETIRNDRQIVDHRHGLKRIEGDLNFEAAYGNFDEWLEAALFGTWSTDVLKAGTTAKSFTVERAFNDVSEFHLFTGVMVNSLSLDIEPNAMVTGTMGLIGQDMTVASSTADNAGGITAAAANDPFDGFTGSIQEGGGSVDNVTSFSLSLENNLAPAFVVGSDTTPQVLAGRSVLTGSLTSFFESETLLNKFLNETESSLQVVLTDPDGNSWTIDVPRIKYTGADVDVTNADEGVLAVMPWQALRDSSEETNLKITRAAA